jgi:proteasome lid subunit RPN8/RPN11
VLRLLISRAEVGRLVRHCRRAAPHEACGLLGGTRDGDEIRLRAFPAANARRSRVRFRLSRSEIARVRGDIADADLRYCGAFHSHPTAGPVPSALDARGAGRPGFIWLIYGVRQRRLRAYVWTGRRFRRLPLARTR